MRDTALQVGDISKVQLIDTLREQGFRCMPTADSVYVYAHRERTDFIPMMVSQTMKQDGQGQNGFVLFSLSRIYGARDLRPDIVEEIRASLKTENRLWDALHVSGEAEPTLCYEVTAPAGASAAELRAIMLDVSQELRRGKLLWRQLARKAAEEGGGKLAA